MITVSDIIKKIESIAPLEYLLMDFEDNVGLLIGSRDIEVTKVLVCLDVTQAVVEEAVVIGANLIICHHPMIFRGIRRIDCSTPLGRKILMLIDNKIAVYAAHTNLDFAPDGINDYLAELIGLGDIGVLDVGSGLGRVGDLSRPVAADRLANEIAEALSDDAVRLYGSKQSVVRRIAVINGSGGDDPRVIDLAVAQGADCLVTAEVKFHVALYAVECGIVVIEPRHDTMEEVYMPRLAKRLTEAIGDAAVEIIVSCIDKQL